MTGDRPRLRLELPAIDPATGEPVPAVALLTIDLVGKGFRYAEVPISYRYRTTGRSFVRLGPYLRRVGPAFVRQVRLSRRTTTF